MKTLLVTLAAIFVLSHVFSEPQLEDSERPVPPPAIIVLGQVRTPMIIAYTKEMTFTEAVQWTGGVDDFGEKQPAYLIRNGKAKLLNLKKMFRDPKSDVPLVPWDIICIGDIPTRGVLKK